MKNLIKSGFNLRHTTTPSFFSCLAAHSTNLGFRGWLGGGRLLGALLVLLLLSTTAHAQLPPRPTIQLDVRPSVGGRPSSTFIYFEAGATTGFDSNYDAELFPNAGLNLASFVQPNLALMQPKRRLVINGLPPSVLIAPYTVNLFLGVPAYESYTLQVADLSNFTNTEVYLVDSLANTSQLLALGTTYTFDVTPANTNRPYITSRFSLLFQPVANPLPVTLTDFTAQAQLPGVALAWHTAAERNSAYFAVERSPDGQSFAEIGRVAAAGTSRQARGYTLYDPLPLTAIRYYRLRQVDLDGTFQYSPVRAVSGQSTSETLSIFPNPARAGATLRGVAPGTALQVFDSLGQLVATASADASGTVALPATLPIGMYLVHGSQGTARLLVE